MVIHRDKIFSPITFDTSSQSLPFGNSDTFQRELVEVSTTLTSKGKEESNTTGTTNIKYDKTRRPVPHSSKRIGMKQPYKKLQKDASSVSEMQTADDFDLDMYETKEVSDVLCQKLLTDAVNLELQDTKGKMIKYYVVRTKSSFVMKSRDNTFTWICSGFDLLHKKREANGEIKIEIQTEDDLGTTNKQVPIEFFTKSNLKELSKYGIIIKPGCELLVSMYLMKVISEMCMESAQQKLGFSLTNGRMTFNAYTDGIFTTNNTFGTDEGYINALNDLINDSVPIQYLLSATISAATMTVLNLEHHMKLYSYSINVVGRSSTGKTITSRLCASIWSDPNSDKVFKSMHSTSNALYKRLDGRFGVPMFFDEGKVANNINTEDFLITVANEREKDRLNPDSTEKATGTWNTVVVVTSEEHIHDKNASQNGGPAVRVHNAEDMSYTKDIEHADAIEVFSSNNYGVLGKLFSEWLIKHREELKSQYEDTIDYMRDVTSNSPNDYTERVIKSYGLTLLTARILCKLGLSIDCDGIAKIMQEQNEVISSEYNMAENALNAIREYAIRHKGDDDFLIFAKGMKDEDAIVKEEIITSVVVPVSTTKKILENAGFKDVKTVVKEIDRAGYLDRQGNGKRNGLVSRLTVNHIKNVPCYRFRFFDKNQCKGERYIHSVHCEIMYV